MLKFLHFGIYFKYFLYLFVAVLKDIISDWNYESVRIIADFKQVIYSKISKYNSWTG